MKHNKKIMSPAGGLGHKQPGGFAIIACLFVPHIQALYCKESSVSLNTKIKELLHPKEYPILLADKALPGTTLLKVQSPARYVIHIQKFDTKLNVSAQIAFARKTIYKRSGALWLFKEVGACIVFTCKHLPNVAIEDLLVDKSGFPAVIIQGVHLVDEKGEQIYNQSKWINRTFGKSTDVAKALRSVAI